MTMLQVAENASTKGRSRIWSYPANAKLSWVQCGGSMTAQGSDFSKSATYRWTFPVKIWSCKRAFGRMVSIDFKARDRESNRGRYLFLTVRTVVIFMPKAVHWGAKKANSKHHRHQASNKCSQTGLRSIFGSKIQNNKWCM